MSVGSNLLLCRLCLKSDVWFIDIFNVSETDGIPVYEVIHELTQMEVLKGDGLPATVCRKCWKKLCQFRDFKIMCIESARNLKRKRLMLTSVTSGGQPTIHNCVDELGSSLRDPNASNLTSQTLRNCLFIGFRQESRPAQAATPILKQVEVFVDVDVAVESGEVTEEERDPLGDEEVDVKPPALISTLDQGASREEDSAPSPTGNAFAFCGELHETGDVSVEASAMTIAESSAKWISSKVTAVSCGNAVRAAVDEGGGGSQETMGAEKNFKGLIESGHHSSGRLQTGTTVSEATSSSWMWRRPSANSHIKEEDLVEGIESPPHNTSGQQFRERSDSLAQGTAGARTEGEEDSITVIGDISNGPPTTGDDSEEDNFHCSECGTVFRTMNLLRRHMKVHCETVVLECGDCRLKFSERSEYARHRSVQHGSGVSRRRPQRGVAVGVEGGAEGRGRDGKKAPPVCSKESSDAQHLKTHVKCVNLKERNFFCEICGKAFVRKDHLQVHLKYHAGVKPYKCGSCEKCFTEAGDLKKHVLAVHEMEKRHSCVVCGKAFARNSNLKTHMLVHTGERRHACGVCSKAFSHKHLLDFHMATHSGEKPHACNLCAKTFGHKDYLKRHLAVHARNVPHPCSVCDRTFTCMFELQNHLAEHRRGRVD